MSPEARQETEMWITETLHRQFYVGADVAHRIKGLQEYLGNADRPDIDFLKTWLLEVDPKETYRANDIQNHLLDFYALARQASVFDADQHVEV